MCGYYTPVPTPTQGWTCSDEKANGKDRCSFHDLVEKAIEARRKMRPLSLGRPGAPQSGAPGIREGDFDDRCRGGS
jgi:hypothetical protein